METMRNASSQVKSQSEGKELCESNSEASDVESGVELRAQSG
jgi:hypothetical protein